MGKSILVLIIFLSLQNTAFAQTKIGLKFSPTFVINRVNNLPDSISVSGNKVGLRPQVGVIFDAALKDNYYFSTGIWYISKSIKYRLNGANTVDNQSQEYKLQYVQIPITLKLFTNEVSIDKKIYAQIGTLAEILVYNEKNPDPAVVRSFNPLDFSLYFGAGMNFRLGLNTMLETGVSYSRGLVNIAKNDNVSGNLVIKNDMVSLDLGLKF